MTQHTFKGNISRQDFEVKLLNELPPGHVTARKFQEPIGNTQPLYLYYLDGQYKATWENNEGWVLDLSVEQGERHDSA